MCVLSALHRAVTNCSDYGWQKKNESTATGSSKCVNGNLRTGVSACVSAMHSWNSFMRRCVRSPLTGTLLGRLTFSALSLSIYLYLSFHGQLRLAWVTCYPQVQKSRHSVWFLQLSLWRTSLHHVRRSGKARLWVSGVLVSGASYDSIVTRIAQHWQKRVLDMTMCCERR